MKTRLLLHACCGVCSAYVPERLIPDFDVTVYYENSNIYPSTEYALRRDAARTMADLHGLPFVEADYSPVSWFKSVRGLAQEPERGLRCQNCINWRLDRTFNYAKAQGFSVIATTLSVSRRKNVDQINAIGHVLAERYGLIFLGRDWKKDSGEILSQERAKKAGIYRQNYCGCVFSLATSSHRTPQTPAIAIAD